MKKVFLLIWNNKQALTGAVTASASLAAGADMISDSLAVKITAVTGIITLGLGAVYSILTSKANTETP